MMDAAIDLSNERYLNLTGLAPSMDPAKWYVVQTIPRHEKALTSQLEVDGIQCFLPLTAQNHKWTDRTKTVNLPLFPGYVFVRLHPHCAERVHILRKPSVVRFVGTAQGPVPVADDEIEGLRRLVENKVTCNPHSYLKIGQRVRVRSGALQGLEGILLNVEDGNRLVLSIDLIQRSLSIQIEGYELETV